MTSPLAYHYGFFEAQSQIKRRKNPLGLSLGNQWYARKSDAFPWHWQIGIYSNKWAPAKIVDGRYTYPKNPKELWVFHPFYTCTPSSIEWDPNRAQNKRLRAWSTSQRAKAIPSPIYKIFDHRNPTVSVQGEGSLVLEHDAQGYPIRISTTRLPLKKVWDKEKYLELRRKRVKAERILRGMCRMGVFEHETSIRGSFDSTLYQQLLEQVVNDENPDSATMEALACSVQGRMKELTHIRSTYIAGTGWTRTEIHPTVDEAFASLRDELRERSYKDTKTYTYEPFDDGRHTATFP